jgi:hypothetical protein
MVMSMGCSASGPNILFEIYATLTFGTLFATVVAFLWLSLPVTKTIIEKNNQKYLLPTIGKNDNHLQVGPILHRAMWRLT